MKQATTLFLAVSPLLLVGTLTLSAFQAAASTAGTETHLDEIPPVRLAVEGISKAPAEVKRNIEVIGYRLCIHGPVSNRRIVECEKENVPFEIVADHVVTDRFKLKKSYTKSNWGIRVSLYRDQGRGHESTMYSTDWSSETSKNDDVLRRTFEDGLTLHYLRIPKQTVSITLLNKLGLGAAVAKGSTVSASVAVALNDNPDYSYDRGIVYEPAAKRLQFRKRDMIVLHKKGESVPMQITVSALQDETSVRYFQTEQPAIIGFDGSLRFAPSFVLKEE